MPELAEVEYYRRVWEVGLGERVTHVALHARNRVFRGTDPRALQRLTGARLLSSDARGKRILFRFSNKNWLGIHLGMSGRLSVARPEFYPDKHDHLVLYQPKRALVFRDPRQFGRVRFHQGSGAPPWWNSAIPEIASPEFTRCFMDDFLQRHRKAPIKAVLLLQNGFSGIGNWMADEILWRAKIVPSRRTAELTANDRARLFRATRFVVRESLRIIAKKEAELPRTWLIHQRWSAAGKCPRHGSGLQRATIAGRTTAWCSKCQH
jgi:formamidopyrimidine-DNA glycosylase